MPTTATCRLRRRRPDLDDPQRLRGFFELIRDARQAGLLLAYHDRSDGGAFAALCEMAFTSRLGLDITLDAWGDDPFRSLFNEELGAVVQIAREDRAAFADLVERHALTECAQRIAKPTTAPVVRVSLGGENLAEWRWERCSTPGGRSPTRCRSAATTRPTPMPSARSPVPSTHRA
jgi:phosphoribosylformylglycinamidine synthase